VVVTRLERQGLVRRAPSAADGRSVELRLSTRGRRAATGAPDLAQARLIDAIERLTPTRRRQLASTIGEVARALAGSDSAQSMFFEERRTRAGRKTRA
jgi:DNA-binding MarR family transcriptional regulator